MQYKSLKIYFATWQALARIKAQTGETMAAIIDRLVRQEEAPRDLPRTVYYRGGKNEQQRS